jgi:hypothetical protein
MDWSIDMPMEWTIKALKQAAEFNPVYKIDKTTLHNRIDSFLHNMTPTERSYVKRLC